MNLDESTLTEMIDRGYNRGRQGPKFPIRVSSLGRCPRAQRVSLDSAIIARALPGQREISPRSLRIFEQGHQRGEALASALVTGMADSLKESMGLKRTDVLPWLPVSTGKIDEACGVASHGYEVVLEAETWLTLPIPAQDYNKPEEGPGAGGVSTGAIMGLCDSEWGSVDRDIPLRFHPDGLGQIQLRGRADFVLVNSETKEFWVIDFKTKNTWSFNKLEEEGNSTDYELQLLAYVKGLSDEYQGYTCRGAWVFYESHDKREHKVIAVDLDDIGIVDKALDLAARQLCSWAVNNPESYDEFDATFAEKSNWGKGRHKGSLGSLPWQCNYCSVGPKSGGCIDTSIYVVKDHSNGDIPKYEVYER